MQTYTLYVTGMHCKACPILVEAELSEVPGIHKAKASLHRHEVEVMGDFTEASAVELSRKLTPYVEKHGYGIFPEKQKKHIAWKEFLIAAPIAAAFFGLFLLLQKTGIVNSVDVSKANYLMAFLIGIVASLSTCMAIVGGLTLSISANFAKEGDKVTPQLLFHGGRMLAFFILGGVIGAVGAEFQLGINATFILSLIVGIVMLLLGINLLDVLPAAKGFQLTLPRFISAHMLEVEKLNHTLTPALLGMATFFLPCGFTQSMQLYTLQTGNFIVGALTMGSFALGTLPVLGFLSFASLGVHSRKTSGVFFKASGLIVIVFALLNIMAALTAAGLIEKNSYLLVATPAKIESGQQIINITAKGGYSPELIEAKAGQSITLRVKADDTFDCSSALVIPAIDYEGHLPVSGTVDIEIPPQEAGTELTGVCSMGMYSFKIKFGN